MKKPTLFGTALTFCLLFSQPSLAEGDGRGGDGFRATAVGYDAKAEKFSNKGMAEVAVLYTKMAAIKRHAAGLGDENRWDEIDWSEYEALEHQVADLISHKPQKK